MNKLRILREDILNDIKHDLKKKKEEINSDDVELRHHRKIGYDVKDTNSNYNDGKENIDSKFKNGLISYIDSLFPKTTTMTTKINTELNKRIKDDKEKKKVQKRVRDTVYKEWMKFLDNLDKRISKVQITSINLKK
ncbi:MAG: hypothetical protein ACOCZ5_00045 [bacterium]